VWQVGVWGLGYEGVDGREELGEETFEPRARRADAAHSVVRDCDARRGRRSHKVYVLEYLLEDLLES
jgi:hypothetical protein